MLEALGYDGYIGGSLGGRFGRFFRRDFSGRFGSGGLFGGGFGLSGGCAQANAVNISATTKRSAIHFFIV